jgi:hypothetical protein
MVGTYDAGAETLFSLSCSLSQLGRHGRRAVVGLGNNLDRTVSQDANCLVNYPRAASARFSSGVVVRGGTYECRPGLKKLHLTYFAYRKVRGPVRDALGLGLGMWCSMACVAVYS